MGPTVNTKVIRTRYKKEKIIINERDEYFEISSIRVQQTAIRGYTVIYTVGYVQIHRQLVREINDYAGTRIFREYLHEIEFF